jgi:urease accessory protein
MHRITHRIPAALAGAAGDARPLPLDHDARKRSRQRLTLDDGAELAIALAASEALNEHDVLVADDGTRFRIVARAEAVLRITSDDAWLLLRAAYHLGNRHAPVAVLRDALLIEPDPVLRDMLLRLGVRVDDARLPFVPESGAYGGGHRHGHDATFADDHALAQAVFVRHEPIGPGPASSATASPHSHD